MNETVTQAAAPVDAKTTATNITDAIQNRANGKAPEAQPKEGTDTKGAENAAPPVDPNAGKKKYVVNSREIWLTPEQADAYVQKGIAFEPQVDQLRRLERETAEFVNDLARDPGKILSALAKQRNIPMQNLIQGILKGNGSPEIQEIVGKWYYEEAVEPSRMTPEQLKAREDARWRQEREIRDAAARDQAQKQENQRRVEMAMNQIKAEISEAMKDSGLVNIDSPLGAKMSTEVAQVMRLSRKNGQPLTPKQAIDYVKKANKELLVSYYDSLDEDNFVKEIGEKNAEKVKKYFLKKVQEGDKKIPAMPKGKPAVRRGERDTINTDDFHDYLDELKKSSR